MVRIALIGCTGSIGTQAVEVVGRLEGFTFSALVAGHESEALSALKQQFPQARVATAKTYSRGMLEDADVVLVAASGFQGLRYTLDAISLKKNVALANKESLVCGGQLVTGLARRAGVEIIPVDSEHSALFQALSFRRDTPFARLILTASGGPFLNYTSEQLSRVTAEDALNHPTWNMGKKITVDSATLLNKGYEVIEAKWLFDAPFEKIEAVVHPESIVHSLVSFADGAAIAQLGYPDMRVPIQLALTYPDRLPCARQLDLASLGKLTFLPLPQEKFPCYGLALAAGKAGGILPTALNAAGEEAVFAFLAGSITFPQIADTIEETLSRTQNSPSDSYEALHAADGEARRTARSIIYGK